MQDLFSSFFHWQVVLFERSMQLGAGLLFSLAGLLPCTVILYLVWLGVRAGQRRQQRARCFIDLLDLGLAQGRTVEEIVQSLSQRRVRDMGVRFHLLAAWMERGLRLTAALAEVPLFLPRHISAMLRVGEEIGNIRRVLPVCRAPLKDAFSSTQQNLNDLMVLLFVSPVGPVLLWVLSIFIFPKLRMIVQDMGDLGGEQAVVSGAQPWSSGLFEWGLLLANVTLALWLLFWLAVSVQGTSAWLSRWFVPGWSRLADRIAFRVPWMHKRMQRDFSAMLSLLLDHDVPEAKAVRM